MTRIGDDEVDHMEVRIGHQFPDGQVVQHEHLDSAKWGVMMFGGQLMQAPVYVCKWLPLPDSLQVPSWVTPE